MLLGEDTLGTEDGRRKMEVGISVLIIILVFFLVGYFIPQRHKVH